jgi:hypothetical protein
MSTKKIPHVPKQTTLTKGEAEITLLVLTAIRSHVIGHVEDLKRDERDIDDVIAALRASGQCVVACGVVAELVRALSELQLAITKAGAGVQDTQDS